MFNQLTAYTSSGTTTPFTYAGPSNTERTGAGTTTILNGILGISRTTNGQNTTSFLRDPAGGLLSMTNSAGTFYYTTDALGSTITLTDGAQGKAANYVFDSWGNTTATGAQAANNPFQYTGGYKDTATGLTKLGARYYDSTTGRFTQPDPSWQEKNSYAYAQCNPTNNSDPSGLASASCVRQTMAQSVIPGAIVGATGGGIAGAFTGAVLGFGVGAPVGAVAGTVVGALSGIFSGLATGLVGGLLYCP